MFSVKYYDFFNIHALNQSITHIDISYKKSDIIRYRPAPNKPLTGIVSIHATIIFFVTPHLTAERRFVAPTPMIEPAMV